MALPIIEVTTSNPRVYESFPSSIQASEYPSIITILELELTETQLFKVLKLQEFITTVSFVGNIPSHNYHTLVCREFHSISNLPVLTAMIGLLCMVLLGSACLLHMRVIVGEPGSFRVVKRFRLLRERATSVMEFCTIRLVHRWR
jgi:hypothetical protein